METSTFEESLHQRVSELEDLSARQKRTTLMLAIGMVGAVALAIAGLSTARAVTSGSLVTSEFVLRGEDGVPRGTWRIEDNGSATMSLNDRNGIERIRMRVLDNGAPGVALADAKGRSRVVLSLLNLTGMLVFADDDDNMRAMLGLTDDGSSSLVFADQTGEPRLSMGVEGEGRPFSMTDSTDASETGGFATRGDELRQPPACVHHRPDLHHVGGCSSARPPHAAAERRW
ncbi:MAG: hypothetical protein PVH00_05980 [Gemmatimonadota bacterium]